MDAVLDAPAEVADDQQQDDLGFRPAKPVASDDMGFRPANGVGKPFIPQPVTEQDIADANEPMRVQPAATAPDKPPAQFVVGTPKGLVTQGNINILDRPIVPNPDEGGSSTVFSMGIEADGKHILIPRVSDGKDGKPPHIMSESEARAYYRKTGEHLGMFDSDDAADTYGSQILHQQQSTLGNRNGRTFASPSHPSSELPQASAYEPSQMEQLGGMIANSAIGRSLQSTMPKVAEALHLQPTESLASPDYAAHGQQLIAPEYAEKAVAEGLGFRRADQPAQAPSAAENRTSGALTAAGNLTSGKNLAIMGGTAIAAGLTAGLINPASAQVLGRLVSGGFTADMLYGLYNQRKDYKRAVDSGDTARAQKIQGEMGVNGVMALITAVHATGVRPHVERTVGNYGERGVKVSVPGASADLGFRPAYRAPSPEGGYGEGSQVVPGKVTAGVTVAGRRFGTGPEARARAEAPPAPEPKLLEPVEGSKPVQQGPPAVPPEVTPDGRAAGIATAQHPNMALAMEQATNAHQPVGTEEPQTGRPIVQPTDNPAINQALATSHMPEFEEGITKAIASISGANLAASRAEKNPERLAEKINGEGKPASTVGDYGAVQISVDSPEARDATVAAIKKAYPVVVEDDKFEKGDKDYGYRNHSLQVQTPTGGTMEVQIVPKEVMEANPDEHGNYKTAREAKLAGNEAEFEKQAADAKTKNDAAMEAFNARNEVGKNENSLEKGGRGESPEQPAAGGAKALPAPAKEEMGSFTTKDGQKVRLEYSPNPDIEGTFYIDAIDSAGNEIGSASFGENDDKTWSAMNSYVDEPWRRKGIASAIYDAAEKRGIKLSPSGTGQGGKRSPDAIKFWQKRAAKQSSPAKIEKGSSVTLSDGTAGTVQWSMGGKARVKTADGSRRDVPVKELQGAPQEMVTLYRGEARPGSGKPPAAWIRESEKYKAQQAAQGRWFTPNIEDAKWYQKDSGEHGQITSVQVPKADLEKYSALQNPEAKKFVHNTKVLAGQNDEYFLPRELAATAKPISSGSHVDTEPIGKPLSKRVAQIKDLIAKGTDVRIFSARVADDPQGTARAEIEAWSEKNLGKKLPVTAEKDDNEAWILDDHANVAPNVDTPFDIPPIPKGKWLGVDLDRTIAAEGAEPTLAERAKTDTKMSPLNLLTPEAKSYTEAAGYLRIPKGKNEAENRIAVEKFAEDRYAKVTKELASLPEKLTVYRAVRVPEGQSPNLDDAGIYWSLDPKQAIAHWGDRAHPETILQMTVPKSAVDMNATMRARMRMATGSAEKEVTLRKGGGHGTATIYKGDSNAEAPQELSGVRQPAEATTGAAKPSAEPTKATAASGPGAEPVAGVGTEPESNVVESDPKAAKKASDLGSTFHSGFLDPELFKQLFPDVVDRMKEWLADEVTPGDDQRAVMRQTRGEMDRRVAVVMQKLSGQMRDWRTRPRQESIDFWNAVEGGKVASLPAKDQALANLFKGAFDKMRGEIQQLKPEALQNYIENYFPHLWERPSQVSSTIKGILTGKRPFAGKASFLKQRTIPTMQDGLDLGFKPKTWNPVESFMLKYAEMAQFLMGHQTLQMMKEAGTAKYVGVGQKAPDGWTQLDDRIASVYRQVKITNEDAINDATYNMRKGAGTRTVPAVAVDDIPLRDATVLAGHYYAPADAAKVFNNFVSRGLAGRSGIYDVLNWMNQNLNALQLGISAFHAATTSINAATSDVALGIQQLSEGKPLQAGVSLAKGAAVAPSIIKTMVNGSRLMREYLTPGSYAKMSAEANALADAGARVKQNSLEIKPLNRAINAWRNGAIREGVFALPGALLDATTRPVMEYYVPRMKVGAFYSMAHDILDQAQIQNWPKEKTRAKMQQAWDSIDNRFGQMVYDNLFWPKALRDTLQLATRSVGWNFGDIREIGGGITDTARAAGKAAQGEIPEVTPRMAFALALPIVSALIGGVLTYLWTGEKPSTWKDYFYPRTADGTRHSIPGYMKDVVSFAHAPVNTTINKLGPIWSMTADAINNRDFYGTEIRHKDDSPLKQLGEFSSWAAKQALPFSMTGSGKLLEQHGAEPTLMGMLRAAAEHPGDLALGQMGFQQAPAFIQNSEALNAAREYGRDNRPPGTKTQAQADHLKAFDAVVKMYRTGHVDHDQVERYRKEGLLPGNSVQRAALEARFPPIVMATRSLSVEQALNVYDKGTDAEKNALRPVIARKFKDIRDIPDPDKKEELEAAYHKAMSEGQSQLAAK